MVWFDFLLLGILLLSTLVGLLRGFVREVFSLLLWAVGLYVAFHFATPAGELLAPFFSSPFLRVVGGFLLLFLLTVFVGNLFAMLLQHLLSKAGLSAVDRGLGGGFGLLRALLVSGALVLLIQASSLTRSDWYRHSLTIPWFTPVAHTLYNHLPESLSKVLRPKPEVESP